MATEFDALGLSFPVTPEQRRFQIDPEDYQKLTLLALSSVANSLTNGTQPLDPDLSAIADLTTTPYGRWQLTSADAAAARSWAGLGGSPTARGVLREVWIAVGTPGADAIGDARNPYRVETAVQFDTLMRALAGPEYRVENQVIPLRIHLGPGVFLTEGAGWSDEYIFPGPPAYTGAPTYLDYIRGWWMYRGWEIHGCGPGVTTIKLTTWPYSAFHAAPRVGKHFVVAALPGLLGHETGKNTIKDVTVDADWANITGKPVPPTCALICILLNDEENLIEHVDAINGYGFYDASTPFENFAVVINTTINIPVFNDPPFNYPDFTKPGGHSMIRNVRVSGMAGNYTSAICIFQLESGPGSTLENCIVHGPNIGPSAYQVIGKGIQILNCKAIDVDGGFSVDTGPITDLLISGMEVRNARLFGVGFRDNGLVASGIAIRDSLFEVDAVTGVGVGTTLAPQVSDLLVQNNTFTCTGAPVGAGALQLKSITGLRVVRNMVRDGLDSNVSENPLRHVLGNVTPTFGVPAGLNDYASGNLNNASSTGFPAEVKAGTVSVPAASATVTGVDTSFLTDFPDGSTISILEEIFTVSGAPASNTSLTLSANHVAGAPVGTYAYGQSNLLEVFDAFGVLKVFIDQYGHLNAPTTNINAAQFNGTIGFLTPSAAVFTSAQFDNNGLRLYEAGGSPNNVLTISPGSVLSSGRTFTLTTGDTDRTLDLTGGSFSTSNPITLASDGAGTRTLNIGPGGTLGTAALGGVQTLAGAGAADLTNLATALQTSGAAQAITLADGIPGQIKVIVHDFDAGSAVLTPATKTGFSTVTFTNAGETVTLQWFDARGWMVISSYLAVVAP